MSEQGYRQSACSLLPLGEGLGKRGGASDADTSRPLPTLSQREFGIMIGTVAQSVSSSCFAIQSAANELSFLSQGDRRRRFIVFVVWLLVRRRDAAAGTRRYADQQATSKSFTVIHIS